MRLALALSLGLLLAAGAAQAAETPAPLASLRNQIEASDYRATGQLVQVDASGNRINYAIAVKGLWFRGSMHTLVEIVPPKSVAAQARQDRRVRILLEMRPDGRDSIRIFRPRESAPSVLPFDRWGESFLGTAISYEDLFDPQYFWPGQTILRSEVHGGRQCELLKSTPGPLDRTHYSGVQTCLDRTIDYPVYAEKLMKQGGTVKEFTYYGLRQSNRVWSATQVEARIRGRAGSTLLIVKRGSANAHLRVNDFQPEQINHFEDRP